MIDTKSDIRRWKGQPYDTFNKLVSIISSKNHSIPNKIKTSEAPLLL